jgi:HEAT repeat protein
MPAMAQDAQDEASLIAVISKADSDWNAKQAACRLLRQKGTVASIPALAVLLADPEMCQFARYALEPMPYPEAGKALLDALDKVKGPAKGGIIATLGARREKEAVKFLMPLLNDPSDDIVRATLGALGRIATAPAMAAVFEYYGIPRESVRPAAAEAALASVQIMVQDGKGELAAPFCEKLIAADGPMYVRTSALYSLAKAQPDKAAGRILEALCSTEPMFRDTAARIVAETSGTEATMLYADALPKFNPEAQEALLRALAERKDPGAGAAVKKMIAAEQKPVRIAAIRALGALGSASDVPALVEVFTADDKDAVDAAEACLTVMPGAQVNAALAKSFATPSAVVRVKVLDLLAARRAAETLEVAAQAVVDADGALRLSALRAMAQHGSVAQAPVVLPVLTGSSESAEKTAAEKALIAFTGRDGEALLPLLTEALASAPTEAKPALLRVVSRIGNAAALETITKAMGAAEAPVADEAVRLVCEWPTVDAASTLLTLAKGEASTRQVLGLRGYIRLAGVEADSAKKAEMLGIASGLAKEGEERKLLIGAYGTLKTLQALDVLVPLLDDATVQNEAATSIIAVASELGKTQEMKSKAVEALKKAVEKCAEPTIKDRAQKAITQLG